MGFDWSEQQDSGVCIGLVLLAYGATFSILPHKLCEVQPPKLSSNKLVGLKIAGVSGSLCYAWSLIRGKCSLWIRDSRYEEGLHLVGSRGSYTRDFLGKGQGFEDTS